jgi:hypothetical protein
MDPPCGTIPSSEKGTENVTTGGIYLYFLKCTIINYSLLHKINSEIKKQVCNVDIYQSDA